MALCIRFLTKSIKQAARAKQWDAALSLFAEAVASSEVDAAAFNAAMNACVAVQKWAMALHLFEKMEDYKVEVNKYVLATCMRAYGEATLWYVAIAKLAEQLSSRTSGIEADDVLFGVLITQCGKAGGHGVEIGFGAFPGDETEICSTSRRAKAYTFCMRAWQRMVACLKVARGLGRPQ